MYLQTVVPLQFHIILVILFTVLLSKIQNNSNAKTKYIVPIISVLLVKYILGDFDTGYAWSSSDIVFWTLLPVVSYLVTVIVT